MRLPRRSSFDNAFQKLLQPFDRDLGRKRLFDEPPRRFTAIRLRYAISGVAPADEGKVQRAVDLSRDKYCSVWHTLKDDIELSIAVELR